MLFSSRSAAVCLILGVGGCSGQTSDELSETLDGGGELGNGDAGGEGEGEGEGEGDASLADAGVAEDGSTPPPSEGISVTLLRSTLPLAGARVVLHDQAGEVTATLTSDAAGRVSAALAPAMLTILPPSDDVALMGGGPLTYVGVEDGDDLVIELARVPPSETRSSLSIQLPAALAGANYYFVNAGSEDCVAFPSDVTAPTTVQLVDACLGESIDILAAAVGADGFPIAFASQLGVVPPAPGGTGNVVLDSWQTPTTWTLELDNLPEGSEVYPQLSVQRGGHGFFTGTFASYVPGAPLEQPMPADFFDLLTLHVYGSRLVSEVRQATKLDLQQPYTSSVSLDMTSFFVEVGTGTFDATDAVRPTLTVAGDVPADADMVVTAFLYQLPDGEFSRSVSWSFVAPPDTRSVKAPALPEDEPYGLANATTASIYQVEAVAGDSVVGFTELKERPMLFIYDGETTTLEPELSTPSSLRRSTVSRFE